MGCNIYMYAEKYNNKLNQWEMLTNLKHGGHDKDAVYQQRDYSLFTMLAGVRHVKGVDVIDFPRGLPCDLSVKLSESFYQWGDNTHSATFYQLDELLNYNMDKLSIKESGLKSCSLVCAKLAQDARNYIESKEDWEKYNLYLKNPAIKCHRNTCIAMVYYEYFGLELHRRLLKLLKFGKSNQIRIIIWFVN
jgi:hypothetical protein